MFSKKPRFGKWQRPDGQAPGLLTAGKAGAQALPARTTQAVAGAGFEPKTTGLAAAPPRCQPGSLALKFATAAD